MSLLLLFPGRAGALAATGTALGAGGGAFAGAALAAGLATASGAAQAAAQSGGAGAGASLATAGGAGGALAVGTIPNTGASAALAVRLTGTTASPAPAPEIDLAVDAAGDQLALGTAAGALEVSPADRTAGRGAAVRATFTGRSAREAA